MVYCYLLDLLWKERYQVTKNTKILNQKAHAPSEVWFHGTTAQGTTINVDHLKIIALPDIQEIVLNSDLFISK